MADGETPADTKELIDLTLIQNGGVMKEIIQAGTTDESPGDGCKVYVHYTGRLLDGTKFDSSVDRGEKFSFDLGKSQVIKAWDLGVASMKRGEKCRLTCMPDYAYGEKGSPPKIPANATLVFDIELFDWELEDISGNSDKSITRQILKKGSMFETPKDGAEVEIAITGTHDGRVFDERELKYSIGEGPENLPSGVETAVKKMTKGETSLFKMTSEHGFGKDGNEEFGVPKDAEIQYKIHLKTFEKVKEAWEMNDAEKIEQSEIAKAKGTEYFKAGNFPLAIKQYKRIRDFLDYRETPDKKEEDEKWNSLKLAANLNLALCYNKSKDYEEAVKSCNLAIEMDSASEKAYFRRGEAEIGRTNYETAKADFTQAKSLNPDNKLAQRKINECNVHLRKQKEKEKKMFGGMFEKFARQDEKEEIRQKQLAREAKKAKADEKGDSGEEAKKNGTSETMEMEPEPTNGQAAEEELKE